MDKWRWYVAGAGMMMLNLAHADSLQQQRGRYQQIEQAFGNNQMDKVKQLMPALQDYPLYPYLQYQLLTQNLQNATVPAVREFIKNYRQLPVVTTLDDRFVSELARREDWQGLLKFSPQEPAMVAARCNWHYAQWATGKQQAAYQGAEAIWLRGSSLPADCDKLFLVWQAAGHQTAFITLERIRLAMKADNRRLISYLVKQLPENYQTTAKAITALQNNPATIGNFVRQMAPTDFTRRATLWALKRLVRQDPQTARQVIDSAGQSQQMSAAQIREMKEIVAANLMSADTTVQEAQWRDSVIMESHNTALIEQRVRLALAAHDRRGLGIWLARLPNDAKNKDEWLYWQADLLLEQGHEKEGKARLRRLMAGRGFYPMVAAQRLGESFPLIIDQVATVKTALTQEPALKRITELMYWGMDNLARSEWTALIQKKTRTQQQELANHALKQGWWDLSVQATITAKLWNHLEQRFPLAWQDMFARYTSNKSIPQSFAMAIARQESGWNPKVCSPVGACGLMQVMPATAKYTAKLYKLSGYNKSSQLLDVQTNIEIGTHYLEYVYQQFNHNRIYAAAAYNAGPHRLKRWQQSSAGRLDPVAFIETIPFLETRAYVKNVLAYDAYYRHFLNQPAVIFYPDEWQLHY